MNNLNIRPIAAYDMQSLLDMVQGLAAHHGDTALATLDDLQRDCLGPAPWLRVLVAEEADALVGYVALCPLAQMQFGMRGMDIHHLFVRENLRGTGIGRCLIDASLSLSKTLGCRYMTVGTHPKNAAAGQVYLAAGFEPASPPGPRFRMRL